MKTFVFQLIFIFLLAGCVREEAAPVRDPPLAEPDPDPPLPPVPAIEISVPPVTDPLTPPSVRKRNTVP